MAKVCRRSDAGVVHEVLVHREHRGLTLQQDPRTFVDGEFGTTRGPARRRLSLRSFSPTWSARGQSGPRILVQGRPVDELDEHAVGGVGMEEGDLAVHAGARRVIDERGARSGERAERPGEVVGDETEMVKRRPSPRGEERRDAGGLADGLG